MKVHKNLFLEKLATGYSRNDAKKLERKFGHLFQSDLEENVAFVEELFQILETKIKAFPDHLHNYYQLAQEESLAFNSHLSESLYKDMKENEKLVNSALKELALIKESDIETLTDMQSYETRMYHFKELFRYLSSKVASLYTGADWRSPSYAFSSFGNIFYPKDRDKSVCNYKRYGHTICEEVESWYKKEILQVDSPSIRTLATASGMSSYALIEDFLNKYVLEKDDVVMTSPYIYFENYEQLELSRPGKVEKLSSYDYKAILKEILEKKPKAVFLDPITNTGKIHLIDLYTLIKKLDAVKLTQPLYLIIDTTVLGEGFNAFKVKDLTNTMFRVISFESCNKYRQLGMELTMLGVLTAFSEDAEKIERSRRNTGQIPYDYHLHVFPKYSKKLSVYRFRKITRNATILSSLLEKDTVVNRLFTVGYPLLKTHPHVTVARKYGLCGGLVTLLFKDETLCDKKHFDEFIEKLLSRCQKVGVPLNHGISFGFEVTRVSASASMATTTDPFLRIATGPDLIHNILLFARQIERVVKEEYLTGRQKASPNLTAILVDR